MILTWLKMFVFGNPWMTHRFEVFKLCACIVWVLGAQLGAMPWTRGRGIGGRDTGRATACGGAADRTADRAPNSARL